APRMQPPGEPVPRLGLGARLEPRVALAHAGDRLDALERVRERVDPPLTQAIELGSALGEQVIRHKAETLEAYINFGDLELALLAVGQRDADLFTALAAHERLADRGLVGQLLLGGVGLGRAHDRELQRAALLVLDVDDRADADGVGGDVVRVDDLGGAQTLLQLHDALLEHRLLVLGVVVLGVLRDVAELASLLDALGHVAAPVAGQLLELILELLEAFWGEDDVLGHKTEPGVVEQGKPRAQAGTAAQCSNGRNSLKTAWAAASESVACRRPWAALPAPRRSMYQGYALRIQRAARSGPKCSAAAPIIQSSSSRISSAVGSSVRSPSSSSNSQGFPSEPRASITAAAP